MPARVFGLDVWIHWLHLMAAMIWVGGIIGTSLVVQPAVRKALSPDRRMALFGEIARRFSWVRWGSWSVLLATGAAKLAAWGGDFSRLQGLYGAVLAVKLALVAAMVVLSLLHGMVWGPRLLAAAPQDPAFHAASASMAFWGKVNLVCLAGIVFCAAVLRVAG